MNWGLEDFAAAAALMTGAAIGIALVMRTVTGWRLRSLLISVVLLIVLAIWAHLAVGIF